MQVKPTMRYHFAPARIAVTRKTDDNKCQWGRGQIWTFLHLQGECKMVQQLSKRFGSFFKSQVSVCYKTQPLYSLVTQEQWKRMSTRTKTCTQIFLASSLIIAKHERKQPISPWMDKNFCHTTEYHLARKRKEVLIHSTTGVNTETWC